MKIMYHVEVCTPAVPPELYNSSTDKEKTYDMNEIMNILNAAEVFGAAYSASLQKLIKLCKAKSCKIVYADETTFYVAVEKDSEDLQDILEYAEENHLKYRLGEEIYEYSLKERKEALYSWAGIGMVDEWDVHCEDFGTKLMCKCETCKREACLEGLLHVPIKKYRKYKAFQLSSFVIVCREIKEGLQRMDVTGCEFKEIMDIDTGKVSDEFYHLEVTADLPSMGNELFALMKCPECGAEEFKIPINITYHLADFVGCKDIYQSSEVLSAINHRGMRLLIVSNRVSSMLSKQFGITGRPIYIPEVLT